LGQSVLLSDCPNHQMLINYLSDYKIANLGLVIGVRELLEIIEEKYYHNQDGRLLVAFGELFSQNIRIYAYPAMKEESGGGSGEIMTASNLPVPEGIRFLYKYLLESKQIVEVEKYNAGNLNIYPQKVLAEIRQGDKAWEQKVPAPLVQLIKSRGMFGYKNSQEGIS
jgi:hypothetical protein